MFVGEFIKDGSGVYTSFNMFVECLDGYNLTKDELEELGKKLGLDLLNLNSRKMKWKLPF